LIFVEQELLEAAKEQMGEAYRDDGPPLGFEFDDVPILPGQLCFLGLFGLFAPLGFEFGDVLTLPVSACLPSRAARCHCCMLLQQFSCSR